MKVKEVIVVEGRYDINTLKQIVDAIIVETSGFGIFSDKEKLELIRRYADARGVIILTDGDGAGFVIRNFLRGALAGEKVKHAYIPDVYGKEKRKRRPSGEGKLGVEGMDREVILEILRRAGATFEEIPQSAAVSAGITKADLFADGLSGRPGSAELRRKLLQALRLPEKLTANAMLDAVNILLTREAYQTLLAQISSEKPGKAEQIDTDPV